MSPCSGSGLDPHYFPAAAEYQVARIAKANDMADDEVRNIIRKCTEGRFLGIFGEETVNVLEVNLMLDGILEGEMNIAKIMIPKISTVFLHERIRFVRDWNGLWYMAIPLSRY